jgi:hypothetical protein
MPFLYGIDTHTHITHTTCQILEVVRMLQKGPRGVQKVKKSTKVPFNINKE